MEQNNDELNEHDTVDDLVNYLDVIKGRPIDTYCCPRCGFEYLDYFGACTHDLCPRCKIPCQLNGFQFL
jgi:hypothetical protein